MSFAFAVQLSPLPQAHWAFELLAYFLGFRLYLYLRNRSGDPISAHNRWWVIAAAAVGAALGSKLLYWLEDPQLTLAHWKDPLYLLGGKTVVGALLGGLIAVEWTKRRIGVGQRTGDLFALPLCAGIAIGRVGCFLSGLEDHTHGVATAQPWGVDYGDGIARHPVQLYEILFLLLLAAVIYRRSTKPYVRGDLFKIFMAGYFAFRLLAEFLKPGVALAGLTAIQWACVAALVFYGRDVLRWLRPILSSAASAAETRSSL